ncbi:hypothetical protein BJ508DRAFT_310136 [Ascobolus immersus RN42]|uniref:Uncharacterized protein n=1 Tax=Ascobolus immersus RN42 TaxID=1160509 RepID=A0A3N4HUH2_ASCIM|nr:hypothetical protein BJ508DRAFT_310136 [Ascobolus immersus RN42]
MSLHVPSTPPHRKEAVTDDLDEPSTFTRCSLQPSPTNGLTTATFSEPSYKAQETLLYAIRLPAHATLQEYQILSDEFEKQGAVIFSACASGSYGVLVLWLSPRLLEELKNGKLEFGHRITNFNPTRIMSAEEAEEGEKDLKDGSEEALWD